MSTRSPHLDSARSAAFPTPRFTGREHELETIAERLEALKTGRGGLITLVGEAGCGKTRLLDEIARRHEDSTIEFLVGRSIHTGENLSFHPFADLLRTWIGTTENDDDRSSFAGLKSAIGATLPEEEPETIAYTARLMGISLEEEYSELVAGIEGKPLENLIIKTITHLFRALSVRGPLVLVLEDLHWADGSSIDLLRSLLRLTRDEQILFILACRPDFERSRVFLEEAEAQFAERLSDIRIPNLGRTASEALIDQFCADGDVAVSLRRKISEKSGGNPFFIEELFRYLLEKEILDFSNGRLHMRVRDPALELPGSIRDAVLSRIDRLDDRAKSILMTASVIGGTMDENLLKGVSEASSFEEHLVAMESIGFIVRSVGPEGRFLSLNHAAVQEAAYQALPGDRREELHRKAALAIDRTLPDHAPGRTAMLAYHFSRGDQPELAEDYLFRAGDEAAMMAASSEALIFFEQAYELYKAANTDSPDVEKLSTLEARIAKSRSNRGDFQRAAVHYDRALELLGESLPTNRLHTAIRIAHRLASTVTSLYRRRHERAPKNLSPKDHLIVALMLERARSQSTARPMRFVLDCLDGLYKLRGLDPTTLQRPAVTFAGGVAIFSWGGVSFSIGDRFLEASRHLIDPGDTKDLLFFSLMRFVHKLLLGDWDEEYEFSDDLVSEGLRIGEVWDVTTYLGLLAEKFLYQGRFLEAREVLDRIEMIEGVFAYDWARQTRVGVEAILHVQMRNLEKARSTTNEYLRSDDISAKIIGVGMRAEIHALLGRERDALADLAQLKGIMESRQNESDRVEDVLRIIGMTVPPFHASSGRRASALLHVAELERAMRGGARPLPMLRRAKRSARRSLADASKLAWDRPQANRVMGTLRWVAGRERDALRWWMRSLDHARRLGMKPEMSRTYLEVGNRISHATSSDLIFDGLRGEDCLARAEEISRQIGLEVVRTERS